VSLFKRVTSVDTNSSSLRILFKIKEAASTIIIEMKKNCLNHLFTPSSNYHSLLKHAKVWLDLDGEGPYHDVLRQCFIRQVRVRYMQDND